MIHSLPTLGLGLSSNAQQHDAPHPYRLLDEAPAAFDFVEYSAPLDVDQARDEATLFATMLERRAQVPLLYHPVHLNLWGPKTESAQRLELLKRHVEAVGSPWVSNDVAWWHCEGQALPGYLYLTPPLTSDAVAHCATHAVTIRDAMPVPLLLENPVVMTARGDLHVLDFMARLSAATSCPLLLDLGHLLSHQLSRGLSLTEGFGSFPFEKVTEIHLAGGVVTRRGDRQVYVDDHPQPVRDEVWALLEEVLPRCTQLKALTYEGDGHPAAVAKVNLRRLRETWQRLAPSSRTVSAHTNEPRAAQPLSDEAVQALWRVFDDVHSGHCLEDPTGAVAELDFRLAVVAQELDEAVPLSRLAVAPSRPELAAFAGSDVFREWFREGTGRALGDAFLSWARARVRERPTPGAEALVSLESWARHTARRLPPGESMQAPFPLCLSEAVHAARALTRHVAAKAWWNSTGLEPSALDGVLQAAARPAPGPWVVTLRRSPRGRVDVLETETAPAARLSSVTA